MRRIFIILSVIVVTTCTIFAFGCNGCANFSGCSSCSGKSARTQYQIDCTLEEQVLKGKQIVNFYNSYDNSFKELKFNLFANAFRKGAKYKPISDQHHSQAYYVGENYGGIEILSVKEGAKALDFSVCGEDENVLRVDLSKEVFPDENYTLEIEFSATIPSVNARFGVCKNSVNLGNFYPILCAYDEQGFFECLYYANGDPFYSDCADYKVNITTDKNYVVASSGSFIKEEMQENKKQSCFAIENARSFAMVVSNSFQTEKVSVGQTRINYYYYKDSNPILSLTFAKQALEQFNQTFGEYPYKTFSVVQTGFFQGGMEYPGLVMISDTLEENSYHEVIVHETAHQWWQGVVGNNEIKYGFLDEGLAEYSVVLFYEKHPEYNLTREDLISSSEQTYKLFCSVSDQLFHKVNTNMLRSLNEFESEYEYVIMAYVKPCIMYDYLRKSIGEQRFFNALSKYFKDYSFKNACPDDLVGTFERCGADSNGFFKGFFNGSAII